MTQPSHDWQCVTIPMDWDKARAAQEDVLNAIKDAGYADASLFAIRLALEEAVANAYRHGNKQDPGKTVTLCWRISSELVEISVEDQGEGFDPEALPDPTSPENIERPHGRGVMLIRAYMTDVSYELDGRRIVMRYESPDEA